MAKAMGLLSMQCISPAGDGRTGRRSTFPPSRLPRLIVGGLNDRARVAVVRLAADRPVGQSPNDPAILPNRVAANEANGQVDLLPGLLIGFASGLSFQQRYRFPQAK